MGTPAMGGMLIVAWTVIISLVVNAVQLVRRAEIAESVVVPLGVMVAYSILGGIDDYQGFDAVPAWVCWPGPDLVSALSHLAAAQFW